MSAAVRSAGRAPEATRRLPLASGVTERTAVLLAATLALGACQEQRFEPPDRERQVAQADSLYAEVVFDTITWESDSVRVLAGAVVYASHCRICHGTLGEGGTEYARERALEVPSLVRPDWEYGDDVLAVRRRVFIGHSEGMPTWGVAGIGPRDIDAAAHYVVDQLRPEVLESRAGPAGDPSPR